MLGLRLKENSTASSTSLDKNSTIFIPPFQISFITKFVERSLKGPTIKNYSLIWRKIKFSKSLQRKTFNISKFDNFLHRGVVRLFNTNKRNNYGTEIQKIQIKLIERCIFFHRKKRVTGVIRGGELKRMIYNKIVGRIIRISLKKKTMKIDKYTVMYCKPMNSTRKLNFLEPMK